MARHKRYHRAARLSRKSRFNASKDVKNIAVAAHVAEELNEEYGINARADGTVVSYHQEPIPTDGSDYDDVGEIIDGIIKDLEIFGPEGFTEVTPEQFDKLLYDAGVSVRFPPRREKD